MRDKHWARFSTLDVAPPHGLFDWVELTSVARATVPVTVKRV